MTTTRYKVRKVDEKFEAFREEELLGRRPKYKQAQLLCEQSAGQKLSWESLGQGNYEATR